MRIQFGAAALTILSLTAGACSAQAGGGDVGGPTVTITSPTDGGAVDRTFMVRWRSSVELGPEETGLHHMHVFVDGQEDDYTVVGANAFEVEGLSPGEHTVNVTLQNADHSPAGAEDEVDVVVGGGSPSSRDTGVGEDEGSDPGGLLDY